MLINSWALFDSHGELFRLVATKGGYCGAYLLSVLVQADLLESPYTIECRVVLLPSRLQEHSICLGRGVVIIHGNLVKHPKVANLPAYKRSLLVHHNARGTNHGRGFS